MGLRASPTHCFSLQPLHDNLKKSQRAPLRNLLCNYGEHGITDHSLYENPTYRISIIVEQSEFDDGESLKLNFVFNFHLGKSSTWYLRRYLKKLSRISSTPFRLQLTLGPRHRQTPRLPSFPSFSLQLQRQQAALFSVAP